MCMSLPDDDEIDLTKSVKPEALVEIDDALIPEEMGHALKIYQCYKSASVLHMIRI